MPFISILVYYMKKPYRLYPAPFVMWNIRVKGTIFGDHLHTWWSNWLRLVLLLIWLPVIVFVWLKKKEWCLNYLRWFITSLKRRKIKQVLNPIKYTSFKVKEYQWILKLFYYYHNVPYIGTTFVKKWNKNGWRRFS